MSYTPTPGSVAQRVLAHLATLEPGAERMGARIAESINVSPAVIPSSLQAALEAGAIFRRRKGHPGERTPFFWSLVDHEARKRPPADPGVQVSMDVPTFLAPTRAPMVHLPAEPVRLIVPAGSASPPETRAARSVFEQGSQPKDALVSGGELGRIEPEADAAPGDTQDAASRGRPATHGGEAARAPTPDRKVTEEQRHADERCASALADAAPGGTEGATGVFVYSGVPLDPPARSMMEAQARSQRVRDATPEEIAAFEKRLSHTIPELPSAPTKRRDTPLIALWSDDVLQVHRVCGQVVVFTPEETRAIVKYLEARA